jgi:hypothetical protein
MLDLIQPYSLSTPDGVILLARHDSRYSTEREQWDGVGVSQPLVRTQQTRFLAFARSLHFASLTNAILCSTKSSPTFTYRIDGPMAVYLGRGDHHDPKYNGMAVSSMLENLEQFSSSNSKYTGPPLNDEYCPYTLITYPSATMEANYVTTNPIYFTVGALLIFGFTSAVFLVYDYMVERRQQKVMSTAVRTNAIVAQLFPSVIRDRIYPTEDGEASQKAYKLANSKSRLKSFLTDGTSTHHDETEVSGKNGRPELSSAPIAELFPDTTVMFADVVGFTAWSSIRDPAQVRRHAVTCSTRFVRRLRSSRSHRFSLCWKQSTELSMLLHGSGACSR